jgi:hypothetical protein
MSGGLGEHEYPERSGEPQKHAWCPYKQRVLKAKGYVWVVVVDGEWVL